jgi:hypothetical protein
LDPVGEAGDLERLGGQLARGVVEQLDVRARR